MSCKMWLFVVVGLFCNDMAVAKEASAMDKASVCIATNLAFGPALTKAGLQIDASVKTCGTEHQLACAVNVLDVLESCAWVAAYITAAAGNCGKHASAACADGIAALVAAIVGASQAGTSLVLNCPSTATVQWSEAPNRKVTAIGQCVVDSWEAAWSLAKAGILINAAIINCPAGPNVKCTLDAIMVTSSIVSTAHFILGAVNNCQAKYSHELACAQAATKLLAQITNMMAAARVVESSCTPAGGPRIPGIPGRRLANTTQGQHSHQPLTDLERSHLAKFNMTEDELVADPLKLIRLMSATYSSGAVSQTTSDAVVV